MSFPSQFGIVLVSYALGCISVGYYLVRWQTGQDLRELGSGATGGRNTSRVLGKSGAIATGIGDILKGVIAMWVALVFRLEPWALALVMIAVLAGHHERIHRDCDARLAQGQVHRADGFDQGAVQAGAACKQLRQAQMAPFRVAGIRPS